MFRMLLRSVVGSVLLYSVAVAQSPAPQEPELPQRPPGDGPLVEPDAVPDSLVRLVRDPGGHAATPRALVFTPDGKKLISTAADQTIQVFDVETRERLRVIRPPLGADGLGGLVRHPVVDRQGERIAFGVDVKDEKKERVRTVFVCSLATGKAKAFPGNGALAFTHDGKALMVGAGHDLRLIEIDTGTVRATAVVVPDKAAGNIVNIALAPDGKTLAVVAGNDKVYLCDATTLQSRPTRTVPGANFRSAGWADVQTLVCRSDSEAKALVILDAGTGKVKHVHSRKLLMSQLRPGLEKTERLIDVNTVTGTTQVLVRTHQSLMDGRSGYASFLFDWANGAVGNPFYHDSSYQCDAGAIAADLSIAAQGDSTWNDILLWDPGMGKIFRDGKAERRIRPAVRGANGMEPRWRLDGKAIVWEKLLAGKDVSHAELDLATLTLRPLNPQEFGKLERALADAAYGEPFPALGGVLPVGANGPLNLDFETGTLKDWVAEGESFKGQPTRGDVIAPNRKNDRSGHQGNYWVGSYGKHGDKPQGTLTSAPFKVTHPWASFLVGGGAWTETRVELVRKDTENVFFRASGRGDEDCLRRVVVNLQPHQDKEIYLRLVDEHSGSWGHINFDDFRLHDQKPEVPPRPPAQWHRHTRGIVHRWGPLSLKYAWPHLEITGGAQTVRWPDVRAVGWDCTFVAGGRVVAEGWGSPVLQVFDPAIGKRVHATRVVQSYIQAIAVSPPPEHRYVLIGSADQTLTVYNPANNQKLLTVFPAGRDWIAWTPQGYYAATMGGERLMGWHVENGPDQLASFYPAGRFHEKFYRPDVIKLVLEKGDVEEALRAADAALGQKTQPTRIEEHLPPHAVLLAVDRSALPRLKLKATATARSKQQPITGLRLLVDGRPLPNQEGVAEFATARDKAEATWTITLPEGTHQLAVLVRSPDASAISPAIEVTNVNPAKQPKLHVLAVGVNAYQDPALKLAFATADAKAIACAFCQAAGEPYRAGEGVILLDARARKQAVLGALVKLRGQVKPNDLVVFFFAGHGVKDKSGFYLLPVDANTKNLAKTAVSGTELRKSLGEFPCQVLLLLDACHSSGAIKDFRPAVDDLTRTLTDDECGVAVLSAAMANEQAKESGGHGLFTHAVLAALNHADGVPFNRHNRLLYVHHLHSFVFDEVARLSDEQQHPFLSLPWVVEPFPIRKMAKP